MKCPHCKKGLLIPLKSKARAKHVTLLSVTACFGHAVKLKPVVVLEVEKYIGPRGKDDFGNNIKPIIK